MQASNSPDKITLPFAESGAKQTIPVDSQIGIEDGRASYTDGFPPVTRTPIAAGGVPPFGTDFNGLFYAITNLLRWQNSGGTYTYDAALSTAIGGYPRGAVLQKSDGTGLWFCTQDDNATDPDAGGAGWVDLTPGQNIAVFDTDGVTNWAVPDVLKQGLRKAHVTVTGAGGGMDSAGGSSSFGSFITAPGGLTPSGVSGGNAPDPAVGGQLNLRGGQGGSTNSTSYPGAGGGSMWGSSGANKSGGPPGAGAGGETTGIGGASAGSSGIGVVDLTGVTSVTVTVGLGGTGTRTGGTGIVIVRW